MLLAAVLQIFFDIGDADIQRTQVDDYLQIQKLLDRIIAVAIFTDKVR